MVDPKPVFYINGVLLVVLAGAMLIPAAVDLAADHSDWRVFLSSSLVTGFAGAALALAYRGAGERTLTSRQAFLLTVSAWLVVCTFGALPFMFSYRALSMADAFFETMSGLTTTGSTVIVGLDNAPPGILLWRGLLHGLGGVGIVVMAVALLPMLRIGGMQLFRMESSDKTEKVMPRISQVAGGIVVVYAILTAACTLMLWVAGMTPFEAVVHAMSTISTGGFSTSDESVGHFKSPLIEWIITVFMLAGGTTFVLFIAPWRHGRWRLLHDSQVHWFVGGCTIVSLVLGTWLWANSDHDYLTAVRLSAFNAISSITTTGFVSGDYTTWGTFAEVMFFWLLFVGACTGSTAGAIKVFRFQVMFSLTTVQFKRLLHPAGVFLVDFGKQRISDEVVRSVQGFVILYAVSLVVIAALVAAAGVDFVTALSGSATALGNVGPGLGTIIGPAGNFKALPDSAKWLLSLAMLLGRLELLTVLVLFRASFWRD